MAHVWFGMARLHQVAFSESHSEERVCYPPWIGQVIKHQTPKHPTKVNMFIVAQAPKDSFEVIHILVSNWAQRDYPGGVGVQSVLHRESDMPFNR